MVYNVVIRYFVDGDDEIHTLEYSASTREQCENKAIRFICQSPIIKVITITFSEE